MHRIRRLNPATKLLVLAASCIINSTPIASAQSPPKPLAFEVATIKPNNTAGGWRLNATPTGYTGMNISLRKLVQEAYGVFDDKLLTGGPPWFDSDKFDLEAKFDAAEIPDVKNLTDKQRAVMLQPLLADRFKLKLHHETKEFPVYNIVLAKSGQKFQETKTEDITHTLSDVDCLVRRSGKDHMSLQGCQISDLANILRYPVGRTVIDKTGLTARYDLNLRWTPDSASPSTTPDSYDPSIFTALQEQLGLKLEPAKAPLDTIVIDHAEHPSEN